MAELRPFRNIFSDPAPTKQESALAAGQQKEQELFNKTGMYMSDVETGRQRAFDTANLSDAELAMNYGSDAVTARRNQANQQYRDGVTTSIDRNAG